ncbi:type 1 glutamine amidotransferase [Streptomyces sp. NPDC001292]|uniref:type 1 glutamine amidotransferase n=1 Tax=Streptomyces sp. NPDC001292 TaxID=3364558 RepID=UPI0036AA4456
MPDAPGTWPGRTGQVLVVQHQPDCPPGYVGERLVQRGARIHLVDAHWPALPDPRAYDLVVSLGSYESADDDSLPSVRREYDFIAAAVACDVPVFGICFGAQLLSRVLGGRVHRAAEGPEIGWICVEPAARQDGPATGTLSVPPGPWMIWHFDVMTTPEDGVELVRTAVGAQAFAFGPHVGVQFHPEAEVDSVRSWARHYASTLRRTGIGEAELLARTVALAPEARRRGHALTDHVVDRASSYAVGS